MKVAQWEYSPISANNIANSMLNEVALRLIRMEISNTNCKGDTMCRIVGTDEPTTV